MRKLLLFGLLLMFGVVIAACDGATLDPIETIVTTPDETTPDATTPEETPPVGTTPEETTPDATLPGETPPDPTPTEDEPSNGQTRNIVLSYADWGDQELNQLLINAFMERYPNITVQLRRDITGTGGAFTESLLNAQAAGVLPDVFAIDNVPTGVSNGLMLDISEFWDADPDTSFVYPNIATTAVYNGERLAIPTFQFIKGIYINITLLEDLLIPIPPFDWTYDEFVDLAIQVRQAGQADIIYGIEPWFGDLDFEAIWPTQDFVDVGYQTFDGEKFNFTSQAWIDAYNAKIDLYQQHVIASFTEEEMDILGDVWPWLAGHVAFNIDGSWMMFMIDWMWEDYGQDVGFWPYPGGAAGQFPPTILDFAGVSSQTENPYEAYLLAKWMTFGKEGWLIRLDLMKERDDLYLDRYPIADYPEVWDAAEDFIDNVYGLRQSIDLLEYSKPDVDKWLSGYSQFWEWVGLNYDWDAIFAGELSPEQFAIDWEERINEFIEMDLDDLEDLIEEEQGNQEEEQGD